MVVEAFTLIQGFLVAVALVAVMLTTFRQKMVRREEEEENHYDGQADEPKITVDRGKELAQTVRMVMRLKRKIRRFKERRSLQKKTD